MNSQLDIPVTRDAGVEREDALIGKQILDAFARDQKKHYDLFFDTLSDTTWNSPMGIVHNWIKNNCHTLWISLADNPYESIKVRQSKEKMRSRVLRELSRVFSKAIDNPKIMQRYAFFIPRYATRLRVNLTLTVILDGDDQDRIIADELIMSLSDWRILRGYFEENIAFLDQHHFASLPTVGLDDNGEFLTQFMFHQHIDPETLPPGVIGEYGYATIRTQLGGKLLTQYNTKVTSILISQAVIESGKPLTNFQNTQNVVRAKILEIPQMQRIAYKRQSQRNTGRPNVPNTEWFTTSTSGISM